MPTRPPAHPTRPPKQVSGGGTMRMRTSDPAYLAHVDHWWAQLFPRLRRFLLEEGGPVLMVQVRLQLQLIN